MKKHKFIYFSILVVSIFLNSSLLSQTLDAKMWVPNSSVKAIEVDSYYTYISGNFTRIGPYTGYGVMLTDQNDQPDSTFPEVDGDIYCIVPDGSGGWYIGGDFSKVGAYDRYRIAHIKSDKTVDIVFNPGANDVVRCILVTSFYIYAGGDFTYIGGESLKGVARLKPGSGKAMNTWSPDPDDAVHTLAYKDNYFYIGGEFNTIDGESVNALAKLDYDGKVVTSWSANLSKYDEVYTIALDDNGIYVGGQFSSLGGSSRYRLGKINLSDGNAVQNWDASITGYTVISTLLLNGKHIYVGGTFSNIGGKSIKNLVRLDTAKADVDTLWQPAPDGKVLSIYAGDGDLYAGGDFEEIGGEERLSIAKLDTLYGNADLSWRPDVNKRVLAIGVDTNNVFIGGDFFSTGAKKIYKLARLKNSDGTVDTSWHPNTTYVNAMVIQGNDLYLGGQFSSVNGQLRNNLAKLDKKTGELDVNWIVDIGGTVNCMIIQDHSIYVGGSFSSVDGQSRSRLAKLDLSTGALDSNWNPNASSSVANILYYDNSIYTCGYFNTIGGRNQKYIAKLDMQYGQVDSNWNPQFDGYVKSIAVLGKDLILGGSFKNVGTTQRYYLAKVDAVDASLDAFWNPHPSGFVNAVSVVGNDIYAGGQFEKIGSNYWSYLVKLDNNYGNIDATWKAEPNGSISYMKIHYGSMYIAGSFESVKDYGHPNFAKLSVPVEDPPQIVKEAVSLLKCENETAAFELSLLGNALTFQWYHNDIPVSNSNDSVLVIMNLSLKDTGSYYCIVENTGGKVYSQKAHLSINPAYSIENPQLICDGEVYTFNGHLYTKNGNYFDTFQTYLGCDSIIVTKLSLKTVYTINNPQSVCDGETYIFNGNEYAKSGIYYDTFQSVLGCDSIIKTDLTVIEIDTGIILSNGILSSKSTGLAFSYQWLDCGNGYNIISGETSSSFKPGQSGSYAVEVKNGNCVDTSSCYKVISTGIFGSSDQDMVSVYPNPVSDILWLYYDKEQESLPDEIIVFNTYGKEILLAKTNTGVNGSSGFDVSNLPNGVYFIKLTNKTHIHVHSFVKI